MFKNNVVRMTHSMSNVRAGSGSWKIEGDYFEACNCRSICPCIFMGDPDNGDCQLTIAWHIQKGQYGQTRLDGLNAVGVFHTPGNMFTGPKWKAAIYLDEQASSEQADALGKIFSGQAGGFLAKVGSLIGEVLGVRRASIQFGVDGKRRWLRIPNSLELEIEGLAGSDPNKESLIINPAIAVSPGFDPVISHSTKYTYHDHGLEWDNSNKNAFYSKFSYAP
ncbi:MAG: DUF1326 domain-containing protein [Candidatus Nitrosopolaris sp.]